MLKRFALIAAIAAFSSITQAAVTAGDRYVDLFGETLQTCARPSSMCWHGTFEKLRNLAPPKSDGEYQSQLLNYYLLAKTAYWAGDYAESERLFTETLDLAKGSSVDHVSPTPIVEADAAMPYLVTRQYAKALDLLNDALAQIRGSTEGGDVITSIELLRAGALVGLKRTQDADVELQKILGELKFDGPVPFEEWPFGPPSLDPYATARRIAAHFQREGRLPEAFSLLESTESKRRAVISPKSPPTFSAPTWASRVDPSEILNDEAGIYIAQGNDESAEPLLRQALQMHSDSGVERRILLRLAALDRRSNRMGEAIEFEQKAGLSTGQPQYNSVDPLAETIGLDN